MLKGMMWERKWKQMVIKEKEWEELWMCQKFKKNPEVKPMNHHSSNQWKFIVLTAKDSLQTGSTQTEAQNETQGCTVIKQLI